MLALNVFLVIFNYLLVCIVVADGELDKDVEIISGKDVPQFTQPLDGKFGGHGLYVNDGYGYGGGGFGAPHVS